MAEDEKGNSMKKEIAGIEEGSKAIPPTSTTKEKKPQEKSQPSPSVSQKELENLRCALENEKGQSRECSNRLKYLQADFENSIKRIRREKEDAVQFGNEQLVLKLLDVAENLERAIEASEKIGEKSELSSGVRMILKQLDEILKQEGLEGIRAEGEKFDPVVHEAVIQSETEKKPEGIILKEISKGYKLKGRLIRPSKVEIAKNPISQKQKAS
jgi:molecular chaperone GrpE